MVKRISVNLALIIVILGLLGFSTGQAHPPSHLYKRRSDLFRTINYVVVCSNLTSGIKSSGSRILWPTKIDQEDVFVVWFFWKEHEGPILFGLPGSLQQKFLVLRFFDVKEQQGIDKEQHLACELFGYREDSNEAAFAVVVVEKIYAHESLTFNNTVASTVAENAVTTAMAINVSIHQATKGLLDKAKGNVLGMKIVRDQSGNTLRVSQSRFYNGKLVQTLLEGHFILSLEGSLSGDCDVKKNAKWSCIYAWEARSIRWSARYLT
nr:zinc finger, CCHC-type [Tanacetum cinerariifolium]